MQTDALRALYEARRTGSIRKAGEKLGLAPSSVSRHIHSLERQFGTRLLDRSARGVALTYAGERVAEYARSVLNDYESLKVDLDDYKGGYRSLIRVALVEGMSAAGPSLAVTRFRQRFRDVRFEIRMMPAPAVNESVRRGDAEIGVTFGAWSDPDFSAISVTAEPLVYCARRGRQNSPAASVQLNDLVALPLALPGKDFGIRILLDQACLMSGIVLDPILTSNSFEILRDFAASGGGGAVLPARALKGKNIDGLRIAPIADTHLRRTYVEIVALKSRRIPRIVKLFLVELGKGISE